MASLMTAPLTLGLHLLLQLTAAKNSNVFISPASISVALSMVTQGSTGATQTELKNAIGLSDADEKLLMSSFQSNDSAVTVSSANGIWSARDLRLNDSFVQTMRQRYQADIQSVDFHRVQKTMQAINQWTSKKTKGLIPQLVSSLDPELRLILANALYFKGAWHDRFDIKLTHQQPFQLGEGKTKTVSMMRRGGSYDYVEDESVQAVRLSYGKERYRFYIFLPKKQPVQAWLKSVTPQALYTWRDRMVSTRVEFSLPRFEVDYDAELNPALQSFGVQKAFTNQAEFPNIVENAPKDPLKIDTVIHKTKLIVNEEGTEAAAVTAILMRVGGMAKSVVMTVDRPFFCMIMDEDTGAPLFMGVIADPKSVK